MLQFYARTICNALQYQVKLINSLLLRFKHVDITIIIIVQISRLCLCWYFSSFIHLRIFYE
jgi:hypothetical protein